jgi:hypothetical protein
MQRMEKSFIKSFAKSLPPARRLVAQHNEMKVDSSALIAERDKLLRQVGPFPPGHYYSPLPSMEEVRHDEARVFDRSLRELPGIDLDVQGQIDWLNQLTPFYVEQPFSPQPSPTRRYYFENDAYSYSDAIFLYCMIRFARPKHIIEIGSGFSSFVMLDTNELFFDNGIRFPFIEPYADRLRSRLRDRDHQVAEILPTRVQDVELGRFDKLAAGDILFVDSSYVAKTGSDVNHILFEILPRLAKGVFIHFHDMFYPFEYPKGWIEQGWFWNEDYLVRAFLQYNSAFKIRIWNQFLGSFHADLLRNAVPLCMKNIGGSLWLERV